MSYRYDDEDEVRRMKKPRTQSGAPRHGGAPDGRSASGRSSSSSSGRKTTRPVRKTSAGAAHSRGGAPARKTRYREDDYEYRPARQAPARRGTSSRRRKKKRTNPMVALIIWLIAIALAFAASYFIKQYCFEVVRVSGDGMYQTMMNGDLVLVSKMDYKNAAVSRGDVVMVELDNHSGSILRRVVGMPGETIEITGGETYIDGMKLLEQYIGLKNYDDFEGKTLPQGRYYILSDNRTELGDSRSDQIGLIEREDIVGKAKWIIWPLNHLGSL